MGTEQPLQSTLMRRRRLLLHGESVIASAGMPNLRRGVNLSHWYAQTMKGHYDEATHLATYNTEKSFK